jgi:hypothetical protein
MYEPSPTSSSATDNKNSETLESPLLQQLLSNPKRIKTKDLKKHERTLKILKKGLSVPSFVVHDASAEQGEDEKNLIEMDDTNGLAEGGDAGPREGPSHDASSRSEIRDNSRLLQGGTESTSTFGMGSFDSIHSLRSSPVVPSGQNYVIGTSSETARGGSGGFATRLRTMGLNSKGGPGKLHKPLSASVLDAIKGKERRKSGVDGNLEITSKAKAPLEDFPAGDSSSDPEDAIASKPLHPDLQIALQQREKRIARRAKRAARGGIPDPEDSDDSLAAELREYEDSKIFVGYRFGTQAQHDDDDGCGEEGPKVRECMCYRQHGWIQKKLAYFVDLLQILPQSSTPQPLVQPSTSKIKK